MTFKVIIIGGSVSGLTMAHALERAGIDYIVLERQAEVTFNGGASIGLQPHGLRIMDQCGMYEDILATTVPMTLASHRLPSGKAFAKSEFTLQIEERHGYPILFFERAELLEILYNHLPDKSKIKTSQRVMDIQSNADAAIAITEDGTKYVADMIIGADGVHSTTRSFMWKLMAQTNPDLVQKESTTMFSEYACAFGVSVYDSDDPDLVPGTSHINYSEKRSHICIVSTRRRKFWFFISKHDKRYYSPHIPRFTDADLESVMVKNGDIMVTERTTLADLWKNKSKCTMVSLEEVMFDQWSHDRLVLLGDAVHKVTPNAGHGGNTAIESAAVLANLLYEAKTNPRKGFSTSHDGLINVFKEYQSNRRKRVANACEKSSLATRLQAMDTFLWKTAALQLVPLLGEHMEVNAASALIVGGEPLKFVDYKGKQGSIPWEGWQVSELADVEKRSFFDSILGYSIYLGLPLFLLWALQGSSTLPLVVSNDASGTVLNSTISGHSNYTITPKNASSSWSLFAVAIEIIAIGLMMAVEGARGNDPRRLRLDILAAAGAFRFGGLAVVGPLYFLAHGLELYTSAGSYPRANVVPVSVAKNLPKVLFTSVIIALVLVSKIPVALLRASSERSEYVLAGFITILPVLPSMLTRLISIAGPSEAGKPMMGHTDMESLQGVYILTGLLSAIVHVCNAVSGLFTHGLVSTSQWLPELLLGASGLDGELRSSYVFFVVSALIWVFWCCRMAIAEETRSTVAKLNLGLSILASTVLIGPGATAAFFWLWREDKTRCDKAAGVAFVKALNRENFFLKA